MVDGYLLMEFNEKGNGRIQKKEGIAAITYVDLRLSTVNFDEETMCNLLCEQLPADLSNVLVWVSFRYKSIEETIDFETVFEDYFVVEEYRTLMENYKTFYQQLVQREIEEDIGGEKGLYALDYEQKDHYYRERITEWESFYKEPFIFQTAQ